MSNYVDISMTTKWQWIGLGHNMVPLMVNNTTFKSHPKNLVLKNWRRNQYFINNLINLFRGGSREAATSKMELFMILVNGLNPLTIIRKHSILDVAAALDPPLLLLLDGVLREAFISRGSHRRCSQKQPQEMFCKKNVLKNFVNFKGTHLFWILFYIKMET